MENQELSEPINNLINGVIQLFYYENKIKPIEFKIEFVKDIYTRKLELAVDDKEKNEIISAKEFSKNINGSVVLPTHNGDVPYILISLDTIENPNSNCQFISTIIHELTHIHDFYDFYSFNKDRCNNIREIDKCIDFRPFQLWTEYNARRKGYYFYRSIMNMDNDNSVKEQIEYILYKECPFHMDYLRKQLIKYGNEPYNFVYNIIQFIGRFSVWNDLFSNHFNVNTLPNELIVAFDNRIINLYEFLYKNKSFDDVKLNLNDLDNLLSKFVREQ